MATNRVSTFYDEAVASGAGKNRVSATFTEVITSSNQPKTRISALYAEIIASQAPRFVDLAGNLGGASSYGRFHYGLAKYSRVNAFAPALSADLFIAPPTAIEISGAMAPQVTFAGSLGFDVSLTALDGSFGCTIAYGAAEMISGPLWAHSEPCPASPWGPSEPCPVPPWMAAGPCDPVVWKKTEFCRG